MEEYSLRSQVFQTIRDDILKGKYKENDELREATLGKELGVSRTPIREAIRKLELEGLVLMIPRKGAEVAQITEKNMQDVLEVRKALEELSVQLACERITPEQVEEMKSVMQHFDGSETFGKTLKALEKEIPSDVEIGQLKKTCENLKNDIYTGNGDITKYNVIYHHL